jgi:predicted DsbA family dithiol-disulfide isomerase
MGVPIVLPSVSPQPHTHLAFEGFQYAKEHGKADEYNHRVLEAFFREGRDIGDIGVLTTLAGEVPSPSLVTQAVIRCDSRRIPDRCDVKPRPD